MLDLIEFSTATFLDDDEDLGVPALEPARRFAPLALAATNDIFSSRKESEEDESFNLVAVIEREHRLTRAQALLRTQELVGELQARFERAAIRINATRATLPLATFASGVRDWFLGNVRWSSECPRYNSRDNLDAHAVVGQ